MKYNRADRAARKAAAAATAVPVPVPEDVSAAPVFFWRSFLCQWSKSYFRDADVHAGHVFACGEQYMMYRKALVLAGLPAPGVKRTVGKAGLTAQQLPAAILKEHNPAKQKALARSVAFTPEQREHWERVKFDVVVQGNYCKFSQNAELEARLLATGERELVEASPTDRIWGIGFVAEVAMHVHPDAWGSNLLGKALMAVRARLRREQAEGRR